MTVNLAQYSAMILLSVINHLLISENDILDLCFRNTTITFAS